VYTKVQFEKIEYGFRDLGYCSKGEYKKSGTKDYLRDGTVKATGAVGKVAGHQKAVDYVKTTCFITEIEFNPRVVEVARPIKMLVEATE
jgi:hypothetical protein